MPRAAWWNCSSGIAGDMALASLLDAGADLSEVTTGLEALGVTGWRLDTRKVTRCGLVATQVEVVTSGEQVERDWAAIRGLIAAAQNLPERARGMAQAVFEGLARAEAKLHGVPVERVHFHEVGGTDAIVDVVGTALALVSLGIEDVYASPVSVGMGTVPSAHGQLPAPAPATLELLRGAPLTGKEVGAELTTPTGAALLAGLGASFGPVPPMKLVSVGYGAGALDLAGISNVVQVVVGEAAAANGESELSVVETTLDDVTGEVLAHAISALISAGALDAWAVPAMGKKGRPGHVLSALSAPQRALELAEVMAKETGTLGVRHHIVHRHAFARQTLEVDLEGQTVKVKAGPYRLKAEYDDCARAAAALGIPAREVARRAEQTAAEVMDHAL
jgi:uncharacterized protein (TIGR00299 family) protein